MRPIVRPPRLSLPIAASASMLLLVGLIGIQPASAGTSVKAISAGGYFRTCALTVSGGVKCWGDGPLGNGTQYPSAKPVDVSGLTRGVRAISVGYAHACALTSVGGVKCWGNNFEGELGDGTTTTRLKPVDVSGLTSGVKMISSGWGHTCAVMASGGVKCWGHNDEGQLGNGTTKSHLKPVRVSGLAGVKAISAGRYHTCAIKKAGGVKCWGNNNVGQLGDGTTTEHHRPVRVLGLTGGVKAISAGGFHTCGLTTAGAVKCWGNNSYGQLGDGTTTTHLRPGPVSGLPRAKAISASLYGTCALTTAGGAKCWGNNPYGRIGDGTTTDRHRPVNVSGLTRGVKAISAGWFHTCALTTAGVAECWGPNYYGELGDGTLTTRLKPVRVKGL